MRSRVPSRPSKIIDSGNRIVTNVSRASAQRSGGLEVGSALVDQRIEQRGVAARSCVLSVRIGAPLRAQLVGGRALATTSVRIGPRATQADVDRSLCQGTRRRAADRQRLGQRAQTLSTAASSTPAKLNGLFEAGNEAMWLSRKEFWEDFQGDDDSSCRLPISVSNCHPGCRKMSNPLSGMAKELLGPPLADVLQGA